MADDLAPIKHELAILCGRKKARTSLWSKERPTEWCPTSVINPNDGRPFTDTGAWEFLAEVLSGDITLKKVQLKHPPGKAAYEFVIPLCDKKLYVKLEPGAGKVLGRSFHYSKRD